MFSMYFVFSLSPSFLVFSISVMECKLITNSSMIVHRDCHTNDEHFMLSYVSEFKIVIEAHTSQCDAVFFSNQTPYIYIDFLAVFNIDFHKLPFISAPIDAVEYKLPTPNNEMREYETMPTIFWHRHPYLSIQTNLFHKDYTFHGEFCHLLHLKLALLKHFGLVKTWCFPKSKIRDSIYADLCGKTTTRHLLQ